MGHGRWEKGGGSRGREGDKEIDVAFADLEAWLDDKEREQGAQEVWAGEGPCGDERPDFGGWTMGHGDGEFGAGAVGEGVGEWVGLVGGASGLGGACALYGGGEERRSSASGSAGEGGGGWVGDDGSASPWSWMPDAECANMMNQAWEGDSGWVDPHEHAQAWRRQETRGDLERELQELERRGVGEEGAGGRPSQRGWEKIEEPFIEEEAEEERSCAVEPLVQVVRK